MSLSRELDLDIPFKDMYHEAVLNIVRTATVLSSAGALLFRRYGLTVAQFNALFALNYKERDITQSELGKRLVVTRASITSVLDKLEAKGLVKRLDVAGNRRIHHVELTKSGRDLLKEVEPAYRDNVRKVMAFLGDEPTKELIGSLEQVRAKTWDIHRTLSDGSG
jgi:MarR family transcriptional regulator, 2-MHQ and catechol-resistance regulon repressor